jgi:hypothetical protein
VLDDGSVKIVQGVREVFEIIDGAKSTSEANMTGKIVLIGRGIHEVDFERSFLDKIENQHG